MRPELPPPPIFVSVDSKEVKFSVNRLESTLAGGFGSVDSKELVPLSCTRIVQYGL